jgi:transketolase
LGEAVAGCLMRNGVQVPFQQIALPDEFLDAGALPTLHDQYEISVSAIVARLKSWI